MLIKELPVLDAIIERLSPNEKFSLENTILVCVQHLFFTTTTLIHSLIKIGIRPEQIFLTGKCYSTSEQVEDEIRSLGVNYFRNEKPLTLGDFKNSSCNQLTVIWKQITKFIQTCAHVITDIIILDDGGNAIKTIPTELQRYFNVIAVEQTSSGLNSQNIEHINFPIIDVATSAAKQIVEPPLISKSVINKLSRFIASLNEDATYGVVGLGVIGQSMIKMVWQFSRNIVYYDEDQSLTFTVGEQCKSVLELIEKSDYVFGCSGFDITKDLNLNIFKDKTLISCSSQDKEFQSLLIKMKNRKIKYNSVLDNLEYINNDGSNIKILRGGYPINLDNSGESVPHADIQLTRGLLLGGVIQALCLLRQNKLNKEYTRIMLDPFLQSFVVLNWVALRKHVEKSDLFKSTDLIEKTSAGKYLKSKDMKGLFEIENFISVDV